MFSQCANRGLNQTDSATPPQPRATTASCSSSPSSGSTTWHPATFIRLPPSTSNGPVPLSPSPSPPPPPPSSQTAPTTLGRVQIAIGLVGIFAAVVAIAVAFWVYRHRAMSKAFRKFRRTYNHYDPNTTLRVVSYGLLEYCTPPTRRRSALRMHTGGGEGRAGRGGRGDNENGDGSLTISRLPKRVSRRVQMRKSGRGWTELSAGTEEMKDGWGMSRETRRSRNHDDNYKEEQGEGRHDSSRSIHATVESDTMPPESKADEEGPLGDSEELQLWKIWANRQASVEESP